MAEDAEIKCSRCGDRVHTLIGCPYVKAVDFDRDMNIMRVEFLTPIDYPRGPASKEDEAQADNYPKLGQPQIKRV